MNSFILHSLNRREKIRVFSEIIEKSKRLSYLIKIAWDLNYTANIDQYTSCVEMRRRIGIINFVITIVFLYFTELG